MRHHSRHSWRIVIHLRTALFILEQGEDIQALLCTKKDWAPNWWRGKSVFYKGWHSGAEEEKKREEKGAKAKKILAGSRPTHVYSVVSLEVKSKLSCCWQVPSLLTSITPLHTTHTYHWPTLLPLFLSQTGHSQLLLPSDPPLLSMVLSPALGWAPSASGADTGHLSSPVTEPNKAQHLITPHHRLTETPAPDGCKYMCLSSHCNHDLKVW